MEVMLDFLSDVSIAIRTQNFKTPSESKSNSVMNHFFCFELLIGHVGNMGKF